jgi:hypothetical protein
MVVLDMLSWVWLIYKLRTLLHIFEFLEPFLANNIVNGYVQMFLRTLDELLYGTVSNIKFIRLYFGII